MFPVVNFLKCLVTFTCCLVFSCCFKTLTFHKIVQGHIWSIVGSFVIILFQTVKRYEKWSIFDEVIRRTKCATFSGPPCTVYRSASLTAWDRATIFSFFIKQWDEKTDGRSETPQRRQYIDSQRRWTESDYQQTFEHDASSPGLSSRQNQTDPARYSVLRLNYARCSSCSDSRPFVLQPI